MQPTQTEIFANTDLFNIFFQYAIQIQTGKQYKSANLYFNYEMKMSFVKYKCS